MRNRNDNPKITVGVVTWVLVCLWLGGDRREGTALIPEPATTGLLMRHWERLCLPLPLKDATAPPPPLPRPPTSINYSPLSPPILPLHCSSCPNKINTFFLIYFRRFQFFLSRLEWTPSSIVVPRFQFLIKFLNTNLPIERWKSCSMYLIWNILRKLSLFLD